MEVKRAISISVLVRRRFQKTAKYHRYINLINYHGFCFTYHRKASPHYWPCLVPPERQVLLHLPARANLCSRVSQSNSSSWVWWNCRLVESFLDLGLPKVSTAASEATIGSGVRGLACNLSAHRVQSKATLAVAVAGLFGCIALGTQRDLGKRGHSGISFNAGKWLIAPIPSLRLIM